MAEDIATLSLKIDSTPVAQASGELNKMAAAAKNAGTEGAVFRERIGGMTVYLREQFKGMAEMFAAAFAVEKFAQWASGITEAAARFNELGIALDVLGRNTGYTRSYIDGLVGSMQKMGLDSSDAREQLARMMETGVGLSHAIDLVTIAQNASIISGTSVKDSLAGIDVAIQTGMSRTLRYMGINVDFVKAQKDLAASLGVTVAQLTDQEKIQARVNSIMEASKNIAGAMAAAWDDPIQVMARAKTAFNDFTKDVAQAFQPAFLSAAQNFSSAVEFMSAHINDIVKGMGALIVAAETFIAVGIVGFLGKWAAGWADVAIALNAGRAANIAAAEQTVATAAAATQAAVAHEALATATLTEARAYQAAVAELAIYGPQRAAANVAVAEAAVVANTAAAAVTAAAAEEAAAMAGVTVAAARAGGVMGLLTAAAGGLRAVFTGLFTLMGGWVGVIAAVVGGLYYFRDAEVTLGKQTVELRDISNGAWTSIKQTASDAWDAIGKATSGTIDSIANNFPILSHGLGIVVDALKNLWTDFLTWWKKGTDDASKGVFATVLDNMYVGTGLKSVIDSLTNAAAKAKQIRETAGGAGLPGSWTDPQHGANVVSVDPSMTQTQTRPVDPAQENAAMKETLALMKEKAKLMSEQNSLTAGQDPGQHQKLAELQQELIYNKELAKATQAQKDEWIKLATAIDLAVETVKVMKNTQATVLRTDELKLSTDAIIKNAGATQFLEVANNNLKLSISGVTDAKVIAASKEAAVNKQLEDMRAAEVADSQSSANELATVNISMIIDDQQRALAMLANEDDLWKKKIATMKAGTAEYADMLKKHNALIAAKAQVIDTQQWRDDVKKMEGVFHDGFIKMLEGGKGAWSSFVTSLRNTFKSELADELYKMFAKPFVVQIVASIVGATGAGNAVAGVTGGGGVGSIGDIASIGKSVAGMFSSSYGQGPAALTKLVGDNASFMLSSAVEAIGIGYVGTKLGSSLGGNNQTGGNIGGTIGGAIGTAFGGPVGTFVGSTIGSFIGSFLGNQTPSNYTAVSGANLATGAVTPGRGDGPNANTQAGANQLATDAVALAQMIQKTTGATLALSQIYTEAGQRDRLAIGFQNPTAGGSMIDYKSFSPSDMKGAVAGLAGIIVDQLVGVSGTVKTQLNAVIKKIDFSNAQQAASDMQLAFGVLTGKLGDAAKPISQMKTAIDALNASFTAAQAQAARLGLSTQGVADAQVKALAALTQGFNDQIQQSILAITDPMAAALQAEATSAAARLQEARDGGANLIAVEQLTALERDQIIKKYAGQATSALGGAAKSILDFVQQLTGTTSSPLATQTSLANAKKYYTDTLTAAQGGDSVAQSKVTQAAKDYLDLQRQMYASSSQYFVVFDSVTASLKMLSNSMGVTAGAVGTTGYTAAQQAALDKIAVVIKDAQTPTPIVPVAAPGTRTIPIAPTRETAQSVGSDSAVQELGRTIIRTNGEIVHTLHHRLSSLESTIGRQQTTLDRLANAPRNRG